MTRILAAVIALSIPVGAQRDGASTPLEPGHPIERSISPGDRHRYELTLAAGQAATVIVEQRGADVVLDWTGTDGKVLIQSRDEIRRVGEERVPLVADTAGPYVLNVTAPGPSASPGAYRIHVTDSRAATADDRALQEALKLRTGAEQLRIANKRDDAIALLQRSLAISDSLNAPDDLLGARIAERLAVLYMDKPDNAAAEALYGRALPVFEKKLGTDDPFTASVWNRVALLRQRKGDDVAAEKLARRAVEVTEAALGPNHFNVATCLILLGTLRADAGDGAKAEEIWQRAMDIVERAGETNSSAYASLLNNLGRAAVDREDFERADGLLRRALAMEEAQWGRDSLRVATALQNLGIVARQRKDYAQAEATYARALAIREKALGPNHPNIASLLNNLALVYGDQGDAAKALELHTRALQIREKATGPDSEATLQSLGSIARTYASIGDVAHALAFQRRADAVLEVQLALNLAIGSERERLAFAESKAGRSDRTISLNIDMAPDDPQTAALAALVVLQRKGRVLDGMADTLDAARKRTDDPTERELLDQLSAVTARLARLTLNRPDNMTPEEHLKTLKELEEKRERLESAMSERSAEFRVRSRTVSLQAVQAAIPEDAALIEFTVFRPFDPKITNSAAYGPPHYAAYVIGRQTAPRVKDLGPSATIDAAVEALRAALRDPKRTDVKQLARAVDERVMQPIRTSLGRATRLLVSPDGNLNLLPFDTLVDEGGHYGIERYAIHYLTSGRDLLRMQDTSVSARNPVIVADPFFGEPGPASGGSTPRARAGSAARRSISAGHDLSGVYFAPLAGTAREAKEIRTLFSDATLLTGREATKGALARLKAPGILHIASHAFFLEEAVNGSSNPLLRSGLALAGANGNNGAAAGGILTALEASTLDLWGTRLVTLSACDTGVGQVRNHEGVYGLRRAFLLAGAETLVMSLWAVSDRATQEIMSRYYSGLKQGLGRGDALRQAQLAILHGVNRQHPYYWGAFIQQGDWRPLDGPR